MISRLDLSLGNSLPLGVEGDPHLCTMCGNAIDSSVSLHMPRLLPRSKGLPGKHWSDYKEERDLAGP